MVKNEEKESENFQKEIPPGNEERNSKRVGGFAMSKTISVTKNPKNCSSCKFRIELGEGLNSCCELAGDDKVWNELSKIYGKDRSNLSSGE